MSALPVIEQLEMLDDFAMAADWLRRLPDGVLAREHLRLTAYFQRVQSPAAVAVVAARLAGIDSVRTADGSLPQTRSAAIHAAHIDLAIEIRRREANAI